MSEIIRTLASMPAAPAGAPAAALLDPAGPAVVLGGADPMQAAVMPSPTHMFGPRGAALLGPEGPLVVSDTGHHRLLVYPTSPTEDETPAAWQFGQPDFVTEGRNGGLDEGPRRDTLNVPTGVAPYPNPAGLGLVVADGWNHRVLIWHHIPTSAADLPDLVLGQSDFEHGTPNRDGPPDGGTLHWPFAAMVHEGRLLVADTGNRRVLVWNTLPTASGQPADVVLGQPHLRERSDNGGHEANASSMRWPHALAMLGADLLVTDAGNNRVLWFDGIPSRNDTPAARVLGQPDFTHVDHNQASYWPRADCVNMPYALAVWRDRILVGDTANSRLLGWQTQGRHVETDAKFLTGQVHFAAKGDNRWGPPVRDSLCWPYGITVCGDTAVVSDSGNHRVCLWSLHEG